MILKQEPGWSSVECRWSIVEIESIDLFGERSVGQTGDHNQPGEKTSVSEVDPDRTQRRAFQRQRDRESIRCTVDEK